MEFAFFNNQVSFVQPWYLLGLVLIPLVWWIGMDSLAGLGNFRKYAALTLRTLILALLVCALAEIQWNSKTDRLTVIFVLDHSDSIPEDSKQFMLDYAVESVRENRNDDRKDMAGVIVFGDEARVEVAPYDGDLPLVGRTEADLELRKDATNLESAMKLAMASFPEGTAKRIVVVSDGNQNLGDAYTLAQSMAEDGVGIDVVPVEMLVKSEISVEKVVLPSEIRKGQKFEAKVVVNYDQTDQTADEFAKGKLVITQRTSQGVVKIAEPSQTLRPGKNVFSFEHEVDQAAAFQFDATFVPDDNSRHLDFVSQNNTGSAFTHVRGKGRVLLIEDHNRSGRFRFLVEKLQSNNIEVDLMPTDDLFRSAAELLQYDCVVLADVPRAGGESIETTVSFSDSQIRMLVSNLEEMGCGIVMIGGPMSFGAGGWSNTELEKAMPVDFQIKNDRVDAVGALVLMMHASEMADGNYWQTRIATEAIKVLGPADYCGVIEWGDFTGNPRWLWNNPHGLSKVFGNKKQMIAKVNKMVPGDMPEYETPMKTALASLTRPGFKPSMKHMIIISDGDATPPTRQTLAGYKNANIKISTVSVASHGPRVDEVQMRKIAEATGGNFYPVKNARALPKIFQREARRVAKPLIKESSSGIPINSFDGAAGNEILKGIDLSQIRPVRGFVMTTIKSNSLVEPLLFAELGPPEEGEEERIVDENTTILATWRYGLGRATVFTTDAGHKWADDWTTTGYYEKFFTQLIRHSMRPVKQDANFTVNADYRNGQVSIVVNALDAEKESFINYLNMNARGMDPELKGFDIRFDQEAPGRYVARFDADKSGNYLFSIFPGSDYQRLTAGITVPYSSEYSDREPNYSLLESLANLKPSGGQAGAISDVSLDPGNLTSLLAEDPFRGTLSQTIGAKQFWPEILVLVGVLFFADVLVRRVSFSLEWVGPTWNWIRTRLGGKDRGQQVSASMARLQSRKKSLEQQRETARSTTRFAPDEQEQKFGSEALKQILESEDRTFKERPRSRTDASFEPNSEQEEKPHTSRLLEAKRKVRREQKRDDDSDERGPA